MAVDFSAIVYLAGQDLFGRAIIVTPIKSNPGGSAYTLRGIWTTRDIEISTNVGGFDGMAMVSDQQTIIDIRDREFIDSGYAIPIQGDLIEVPAEGAIPAEGIFEITDTDANGGGETTLTVRKYGPAEP
jgi:hypothetical protein